MTKGWDERDYRLWSEIQALRSFGLVAGDPKNPMLAFKDVERCMKEQAQKRANDEGRKRNG